MLGQLSSLTGGGGMSASSSASSGMDSSNSISSGSMHIGGLNMAAKSGGINSETLVIGAGVVAVALGALWAFKKIK